MAKEAKRASTLTTLKVGSLEIAVGLFATVEAPSKLQSFETAGPNGGKLQARQVARPVPVEEIPTDVEVPVQDSDPLAALEDPAPPPSAPAPAGPSAPLEPPATLRDAPDFGIGSEPTKIVEEYSEHVAAMTEQVAMRNVSNAIEPSFGTGGLVDGQYGRELVEEGSGVVVKPEDVRKGVRLEDGTFVDCTKRLEEIEEQTRLDGMAVVAFVDLTHVPRARVKGASYIGAADEKAPVALRLLAEGLKKTRRAAVVKVTKRSRQTLAVISVWRDVLVLSEMVYAEDFRDPPARAKVIRTAEVTENQVLRICDLISAMGDSPTVLDEQRDDAIALREQLREDALAGRFEGDAPTFAGGEVLEEHDVLMEQLEASLAAMGA